MTDDLKSRAEREMAEQQKAMREMGPYMTMGIQLVLTILAFFGLGYWLDSTHHSGSLWRVVCTGFGAFAGLTYFVLTVLRLSKNDETKGG
ncbi:MAG: AtpZ/AtpI family protein [Bacteroidota bacterium]|nr:AtpZ/AtpI family protein [Bacteroidota bacterium]MDP4233464.1 AtpZ/AtpI family protein [Bacteroidota bacterium]MDP4242330.1 AtpZ/AtpI family protein [Bacteroidota bacterium]MDP4287086.1 AtpZ/AtpI family protein [Bacteroidota bacterium]